MDGPEVEHANDELIDWFVRNGDDNIFYDNLPNPTVQIIGDTREMDAFTTAELSNMELAEITTWLQGLPRAQDGMSLYMDHCLYCHGPSVPNAVPNDPGYPRGRYYVKPGIEMDGTWVEFRDFVRNGNHPAGGDNPDHRRRYMPAFSTQLITNAELSSIAQWICGQYPSAIHPAYCDNIP